MVQTGRPIVDEAAEAGDSALVPTQAAPAAGLAPRRPILDVMLDAHLRGERHWPLVARIIAAVESGARPLTRDEVRAAIPEVGADRVIGALLARGVLVEQASGRRMVLAAGAPRSASTRPPKVPSMLSSDSRPTS